MLRGSKTGIISAALVVVALGGCSSITNSYDDLMGVSRTVPEGAEVNFNNRHAPVLNNVMPSDGSSDTRDIYSPDTVGRRVPVENTESVQAAPVPQVTASDGAYPSLANVPPMPSHTPKEESTAELGSLTTDRNTSESGRKQLMSDPNATVMTSPQTGQLVANPAEATAPGTMPPPAAYAPAPPFAPQPALAPQTSKEDGGFNSWLHHVLPSDDQANATPVPAQQPHDLMANAPAEPSAEVIHLTPPVAHAATESDLSAPATDVQPVHLHPPAAVAESSEPSAEAASPDQSVTLVPPPATSQTQYLPESRYAARRMQTSDDDDSN